MFVVPVNPNAIIVPMIPTGCMKSEFDSNYPVQLNGTVSHTEFHESIQKINEALGSNKCFYISIVVFVFSLVGGLACIVAGPLSMVTTGKFTAAFPALIATGVVLMFGGLIGSICGCICMQSKRMARVQAAVAEESEKYSRRSVNPCSWRLNSTAVYNGRYVHGRPAQTTVHQLLIELGQPGAMNATFQPGIYAPPGFQDRPPSYSNATNGFCRHCGAKRQDPMGRFCGSCGQPF